MNGDAREELKRTLAEVAFAIHFPDNTPLWAELEGWETPSMLKAREHLRRNYLDRAEPYVDGILAAGFTLTVSTVSAHELDQAADVIHEQTCRDNQHDGPEASWECVALATEVARRLGMAVTS